MELSKISQLQWRKLLGSEAGLEGLAYLKSKSPNVGCGEPHEIIFGGGFVDGYNKCLSNILELIDIAEKSETSADND